MSAARSNLRVAARRVSSAPLARSIRTPLGIPGAGRERYSIIHGEYPSIMPLA